jgi:CRISPR-associated protein Cmr5
MSGLQTRAQKDLSLALQCVRELEGQPEKEIYGGLCHKFPIMVLTSGLCQAVAFSEDKGSKEGSRGKAHQKLLKHVGTILDLEQNALLKKIQSVDALEYMHYTRRVLESWIYFKRFAVSVLKVENSQVENSQVEDTQTEGGH